MKSTQSAPLGAAARLAAMDVYRGFVMFLMMAEVLEYCAVAAGAPASGFWRAMCWHQSHVEWAGCSLHDLIQPSFSFLVGAALPFSIAARQAKGQGFGDLLGHTIWRALVLILLGVFLRSMGSGQTYWTFEDTLSQIGLGYVFLFLLGFQSIRVQIGAFFAIVIGYWAAFVLWQPPTDFAFANVGVGADWAHFQSGFARHWDKNCNLAWGADTWFLNLFPRASRFVFNEGGYSTLSFIPTLGTMILGLFAGQILRGATDATAKIRRFVLLGAAGLAIGWVLDATGICPNVKRIWTPAWVFFSGGWCFLLLAAFYFLVDVRGIRRPFFWLTVIGMNSIAAYVLAHTVTGFVHGTLQTHFGAGYDQVFGAGFSSLVRGGAMLLAMWGVLFWMWRRRLFIRV